MAVMLHQERFDNYLETIRNEWYDKRERMLRAVFTVGEEIKKTMYNSESWVVGQVTGDPSVVVEEYSTADRYVGFVVWFGRRTDWNFHWKRFDDRETMLKEMEIGAQT